jgi:hypothetical protein
MLSKEKFQLFSAEYYKQEIFLDVVTKRKITKHISDINDTISEEDIKNVKTNFGNLSDVYKNLSGITKENNN